MANKKPNSQEPPFSSETEPSFGMMFENHPAIMLLIDLETGLILEANPAALNFYGYPKEKFIGLPLAEINCLSDRQLAVEREKAKNEGRNYIVLKQRLANGQACNVEELSSSLVWQHKLVLFIIIHVIHERLQQPANELNLVLQEEVRRREITLEDLRIHKIELEMQNEELRRSQAELNRPRARFFDLYDLAPVGYCTVNAEDFVLETNLTTANLLGVTRVDILKKPFHRFIHPEQQLPYFHFRRQIFETGQPQILDVQLLKKDGSAFWAHLEAASGPDILESPKKDADRPISAKIVISDISERKQTEQILQENRAQLAFQIAEKEKRAAELVIANQELTFQNQEKAKRAAELEIANQELAFQNQEKAKRAAELEIANQELKLAFDERNNLLKDMRGYQFELEFNNGELRRTQVELKSVRDRYVDLYDLAPIGYCTVNEKGLILETNLTAVTLLGVSRSLLINEPFARFIFKEHQDSFYLAQRKLIETRKPQAIDLQMVKEDGALFWTHLQITFEQLFDASTALRVVFSDISERKRAEEALRASEQLYQDMFEQAAIKIIIDPDSGDIVKVNQAAASFYGFSIADLEKMNINQLNILPDEQIKAEMKLAAAKQSNYFNFQHRLASGEIRDVEIFSGSIEWKGRNLLFSIIHDVTERKLAEEKIKKLNAELEKLVMIDFLTGLNNRRYFMQRLTEELKRENRSNLPLSLLMLDIDWFKKINDTYGHTAGDMVLQQVAVVLSSNLREIDILGRIGGEEFAILLPNTSLEDAALLAERIRQFIENTLIDISGQSVKITVSIGVAEFEDEMSSISALLRNADAAMYQAKHSGRNCVRVFRDLTTPPRER